MRADAAPSTRRRGLKTCVARRDHPRVGWRWISCCAAAAGLVVCTSPTFAAGDEVKFFQPSHVEPLRSEECPASCSDVFGKLELVASPRGGEGYVQRVELQERGEPKSGTGFMFEAATGALAHACMYLQSAYGKKSCYIEWQFLNRTMIFDPSLATDGPCRCDDVDLVTINMGNDDKHSLPVAKDCAYRREAGIAKKKNRACNRMDSLAPREDYSDLERCVREADCQVVDHRLQMSVMRDPRPVAVSAYFHQLRLFPRTVEDLSVDEYVLDGYLAAICEWMTLRHYLFHEVIGDKASEFWYDDAEDRPVDWHHQFLDFVGLRLPSSVVERAADVAVGRVAESRISMFPSKGIDEHVGGAEAVVKRTYRDEVRPETLELMDDVLRTWLSPDLLARVGVV